MKLRWKRSRDGDYFAFVGKIRVAIVYVSGRGDCWIFSHGGVTDRARSVAAAKRAVVDALEGR